MADADKVTIIDTEASNALKTLSWLKVKELLKTYFDTLYGAIGAAGDMVLASVQTVTGLKTFHKDKLAMKGTSTGTTTISTANTGTTNYTQVLPAKDGTFAMTSDITAGSGDMILDSFQLVTGLKVFDKLKLALIGSGSGKTMFTTANDSDTETTVTFPNKSGTVAMTSDITAAAGDVTGPSGATADDIALFDGATGKLLKDGGKKLSDLVQLDSEGKTTFIKGAASSTVAGSVNLRSTPGTVGSPTATQSGDMLGEVTFGGYGATDWLAPSAGLRAYADENFTDAAKGAALVLFTNSGGTTTLIERLRITKYGKFGFGVAAPTAYVHYRAGTSAAQTAPMKFETGTVMSSPEAGAMEWDGTNLFVTQATGPTRKTLAFTTDITDAVIVTSDVTTNDAGTSKHGFAPKATAPAANALNVVGITNGETVYTNKALLDTTTPSTQNYGDSASAGTSLKAAHADHKHAMPAAVTDATIALTDVTTNNAGTSKHGWAPKATAPGANELNVVGITNGETVYSNKALLDSTTPSTQAFGDSASAGTSLKAAHADHKHAMPAAPTTVSGSSGSVKSPATTGVVRFTGMGAGTTRDKTVSDGNDTLVEVAAVQSITGAKTFDSSALKVKGSSTGVTTIASATADGSNYTQTLPAKTGTFAMTSDITGTNSGTNTGDETAPRIATLINGVAAKTSMVDADKIAIIDTEASNGLKTLSWQYVKSILKTYFDTVYGVGDMVLSAAQSISGAKTFDSSALKMKGSSTGVTTVASANTGASNYTLTMPAETATLDTRTIQVTSITVAASGWTTDGSLKKYQISDSNITANSVVEVIPDNSTIDYVTAAQVLPATSSEAGKVNIWAKTTPTGDFGVTINIKTKA